MKRCPRCHSSMLLDHGGPDGEWVRAWKCLGCGREVIQDQASRHEDERLLQVIRRSPVRH